MTSRNHVTVLCPNGRRVIVKITPGTSLLQVLEEACQKQSFDPNLYNLKHLRRNLDLSTSIRYSNIPNNAQLEVIDAVVPRVEGLVTVNLATDTGQRLIADFPSNAFLWDILKTHEEKKENRFHIPSSESGLEPVIVYSLRRISGDELKSTTLKSLGLYNGRCMLRYNTQTFSPSGPIQANVSSPLVKPTSTRSEKENKEPDEFSSSSSAIGQTAFPSSEGNTLRNIQSFNVNAQSEGYISTNDPPESMPASMNRSQEEDRMDMEEINAGGSGTEKTIEIEARVEGSSSINESSNMPATSETIKNKSKVILGGDDKARAVIPLGDHDAILFSLDDAPPTIQNSENDDFFEVSLNDVRSLHRDQVMQLKELEEAPLITREMRQLERDSRLLSAMNRHPVTQLRICFPDQNVIQASFKPRSTVAEVRNFLKPFLIKPDLEFNLYTTFPRRVLDPEITLVEADCIPKARLYFSASADGCTSFLSKETLKKKSSFEAASSKVVKSRNCRREGESSTFDSSCIYPVPSTSSALNRPVNTGDTRGASSITRSQQMPKWLKLGK